MAWTAPMTFVANSVLTAAQLNTHLRDNMMETAPAKATTEGGFFVTNGMNSIVERLIKTARVAAPESTTSTTYTNLTTVGPSVTCETGTRAMVMIYCNMTASSNNTMGAMSWAISGATTRSALDMTAARVDGIAASNTVSSVSVDILTTLTPGVNTFTAQYKVGSTSYTFNDRFIGVFPL